ncbi:hypothetical protein KUTeg_002734 [Tegillarca granosa]|uniref:SWIM-type domain-containing protein n=1 Tax=Tegillarca granosa TaxID=220873 RepID=A0ABQ9FR26_TEGGR|nr:hypothetical protein KUTeg_002734 [Tegillarca granosa]
MAAFPLDLIPEDFSITYFKVNFSQKALNRGLSYYKEGYIHNIKVTKGPNGETEISGRCYKSMRKGEKPHVLSVTVTEMNSNHFACDAYCSCTAGTGGTCSHMVGLVKTIQQMKILGLKDAPAEQACTSLPQTWHIPRGNKINPVSVNKVVVTKAKEKRQKAPIIQKPLKYERLPTITDLQATLLKTVKGAPISRLSLSPRPLMSCDSGVAPLGSVLGYQSLIKETKFNKSSSVVCANLDFPKDTKVKLPPWHSDLVKNIVNSVDIEMSTREQHKSLKWHEYRKTRITASKMHRIIQRKRQPTNAMLHAIFSVQNFNCAATDYGICKEKAAKAKYFTY